MLDFDPSLISVDEARAACEVDGASKDELLRGLVLAATALAESETRPNLKSRVYHDDPLVGHAPAIVVDGSGFRHIDLPYDPVTAVAKVEILSDYATETWEEVDLSAYPCLIDAQIPGRIFFRGYVVPWGQQNVRVSVTAGYISVPEKLKTGVKHLVLHLYKQPQRQIAGVASRTFEGATTTYLNEDMPKTTRTLLREYARFAV